MVDIVDQESPNVNRTNSFGYARRKHPNRSLTLPQQRDSSVLACPLMMNEHDRVTRGKNERTFRFVREKLIHGLSRSGAGRKPVVVEHHECPVRHAGVEVLAAVENRPVEVEVNMRETNLVREISECFRYPSRMKNRRGNQRSNRFQAGVSEISCSMQIALGIGIAHSCEGVV